MPRITSKLPASLIALGIALSWLTLVRATPSDKPNWDGFALLVIDVQNDFWGGGQGHVPGFAENTAQMLQQARKEGLEVIHVRTRFAADKSDWPNAFRVTFGNHIPCLAGTPGVEPADFAREAAGERVFYKKHFDAFTSNELLAHLRARGVKRVFLAGLTTDVCILSSALGAGSHGYVATVVNDCCSAAPMNVHSFIIHRYEGLMFDVKNHDQLLSQLPAWRNEFSQFAAQAAPAGKIP